MLVSPSKIRAGGIYSVAGMLARWRYQALSGLIVSTLLPYAVRLVISGDDIGMRQLNLTLLWGALAVILGNWFVRNVSVFPGVESHAYLVPSFTASFAAIGIILTVGRFEYARSQLIAGYGLSVIWSYIVQLTIQRHQWLRIGYLPFGAVENLPDEGRVSWIRLRDEEYPINAKNVIGHFDAVAADLRIDLPDRWERALSDFALSGIPVYHIKHLSESLTGRVQLEHLSENSFGSLVPNTSFLLLKRMFDWMIAASVAVLLLPVFIVIAVAIKATSNGPALFKQKRIGFRGEPFLVYKFRTMRVAEAGDVPAREAAMTQAVDARVTSLGRFLRHTRIDELPQIINILKGEMSWIGPRPEAEILSRWYEDKIPFYRYRHIVSPGITGWAQVMQGHVAEIEDVQNKLHYDFYYIKNFSPWMDLLIVGRTIRTMISGFGAR